MLRVLQTLQVLEIQHLTEHLQSQQYQMIKSFNIQQLMLMVRHTQQVILQVILQPDRLIYQDSKEMIYNLIITFIVVK